MARSMLDPRRPRRPGRPARGTSDSGSLPMSRDRDALGDRVAARRHRLAGEALAHRRIARRLDADDLDVRLQRRAPRRRSRRSGRRRRPARPACRARGTSSSISSADRALAGDDARIVVGMDEDQLVARRRGDALRAPASASVSPFSTTLAPWPRVCVTLVLGVKDGMTMVAGMPSRARVVGDALRVVAGRHGDHAALALLRRELQQLVQRAALLERGGELQVLELEPDLGPGDARQRLAAQAGRVHDDSRRCVRRPASHRRA